jgi:hypothetical protein
VIRMTVQVQVIRMTGQGVITKRRTRGIEASSAL